MQVTAYKSPLVKAGDDLWQVLKATLPEKIPEKSVVIVTSKIVALCQNRVVKIPQNYEEARRKKLELIKQEAEYYTLGSQKYDVYLTIKHHHLIATAGIDESNTGGYFVLWPENLQKTVNEIWQWLRTTYNVQEVGVIISDSQTTMLRWGVIGTALSHAGFVGLESKIGQKDLYGREMKMTQVSTVENLAIAGVFVMGECAEQRPVAFITDVDQLEFQDRVPTSEEIKALAIDRDEDIYGTIIGGVDWKKGEGKDEEY